MESQQNNLKEYLEAEGYSQIKHIEGLGLCGIRPFIYTTAIVVGLNETGYKYRYCYPKNRALECVMALHVWDGKGDPQGNWIKRKGEGGDFDNPNFEED